MSIANLPGRYLTIAEVADIMRISKMTVYRLVHAHELASLRFGNSYRISDNALDEYIRKAGDPPRSGPRPEAPPIRDQPS